MVDEMLKNLYEQAKGEAHAQQSADEEREQATQYDADALDSRDSRDPGLEVVDKG